METVGTSIPRKWRNLFDDMINETSPGGNQSDAMAGGMLLWMGLPLEERLEMMVLAHNIRLDKAND